MAYASQATVRSWWSPSCKGPWATVSLYGLGRVSVRPSIVEATKALNQVLAYYKYATRRADTGAYNCRNIAGTRTRSMHAYGTALDINWQTNPNRRILKTDMTKVGDGRMPTRIEAIRTNNGRQVWRWGGRFTGSKDAMHYEICCSPADLRTGINWRTVVGSLARPAPAPLPAVRPVLRYGSRGSAVRELQWKLAIATKADVSFDGIFGPRVLKAVTNFQRYFGLHADGIVGPKTWGVLDYVYSLRNPF